MIRGLPFSTMGLLTRAEGWAGEQTPLWKHSSSERAKGCILKEHGLPGWGSHPS